MQHLTALVPLVGIMAAERTTDRPDLFDDARQEGLIAAWQAELAKPDAGRNYPMVAARYGVVSVLRGRPMTGAEGRRGWQDAADYADPLTYSVDDGEDESSRLADPSADDALAAVEVSVHSAEVRAAVADLPDADRDIVEWRFIAGETWPQISARLGHLGPEAIRRRFERHIAPVLADRLSHLKGLVA